MQTDEEVGKVAAAVPVIIYILLCISITCSSCNSGGDGASNEFKDICSYKLRHVDIN